MSNSVISDVSPCGGLGKEISPTQKKKYFYPFYKYLFKWKQLRKRHLSGQESPMNSEIIHLSFYEIPACTCDGELRLKKLRTLSDKAHCQFSVWEVEIIENTLQVIQGNEQRIRTDGHHRQLWWNVRKGFKFAVKFHAMEVKKPESASEKYKRKSVYIEGQHLQKLSMIWKRLEPLSDDESNDVNGDAISHSSIPWKEGHQCPVPQYYWTLFGRLYIQNEINIDDTPDVYSQSILCVGMELIRGISVTDAVRDVRCHGVTTTARARLLIDISRCLVRSQRFVAGDFNVTHQSANNDFGLINWDIKPGNMMLVLGETSDCFGKELNFETCPAYKQRRQNLSGTECCFCPSRLKCIRAVVIDIGDALPGRQFLFPALGPNMRRWYRSRKMMRNTTESIDENSTNRRTSTPTSQTIRSNGDRNETQGEDYKERESSSSSENHNPLSDFGCNDIGDLKSNKENDKEHEDSNNKEINLTTLNPHLIKESTLPLFTHQWENDTQESFHLYDQSFTPWSHVVCTSGFCSPECAILVFLLSTAPCHLAFRRMWYSNDSDVSQLIDARNARRNKIWDRWIAEESIVIIDASPSVKQQSNIIHGVNDGDNLRYSDEIWGVRFTERTVVFSLGLVFSHLWHGTGLLTVADHDPVHVIDALCEWSDDWNEAETDENSDRSCFSFKKWNKIKFDHFRARKTLMRLAKSENKQKAQIQYEQKNQQTFSPQQLSNLNLYSRKKRFSIGDVLPNTGVLSTTNAYKLLAGCLKFVPSDRVTLEQLNDELDNLYKQLVKTELNMKL